MVNVSQKNFCVNFFSFFGRRVLVVASKSGRRDREQPLEDLVEGDDGVLVVVHSAIDGRLQEGVVSLLSLGQAVLEGGVFVHLFLNLSREKLNVELKTAAIKGLSFCG